MDESETERLGCDVFSQETTGPFEMVDFNKCLYIMEILCWSRRGYRGRDNAVRCTERTTPHQRHAMPMQTKWIRKHLTKR